MDLVIGGYANSKLSLVLDKLNNRDIKENIIIINENNISEFLNPHKADEALGQKTIVINHLHLIVKKLGYDKAAIFVEKCKRYSFDLVVISDEIGNGIIPLQKEDRLYRDEVGRLLCELAKMSDNVERVICGIVQKIK